MNMHFISLLLSTLLASTVLTAPVADNGELVDLEEREGIEINVEIVTPQETQKVEPHIMHLGHDKPKAKPSRPHKSKQPKITGIPYTDPKPTSTPNPNVAVYSNIRAADYGSNSTAPATTPSWPTSTCTSYTITWSTIGTATVTMTSSDGRVGTQHDPVLGGRKHHACTQAVHRDGAMHMEEGVLCL